MAARDAHVWRDGRFDTVALTELPPVTEGWGLFETLLVEANAPVLLDEHLDRIFLSARLLGLPIAPAETDESQRREQVRAASLELARRTPYDPGRMRLALDSGVVTLSLVLYDDGPSDEDRRRGAWAAIADESGHPLGAEAGHKVIPYTPLIEAREAAQAAGCVEVVFKDHKGHLLEGSASNLFVVLEGALLTPPLRGILPGVTRAAVLAAARRLRLSTREADVSVADLPRFEEAFITGSLKEILPLSRLGDQTLPVGPISLALLAALRSDRAAGR